MFCRIEELMSVNGRVAVLLGALFLTTGGQTLTRALAVPQAKPTKMQSRGAIKAPERDHAVQNIIDLAAGVPPEFGADVLMRLVESDKTTDHALKVELLKEAFDLAESAQQPVSREPLNGSDLDTRSGYLAIAYFLGLDRLSLQSRAARDMLPLDAAEARALFTQVQLPILAPLNCKETLTYAPKPLYETLAYLIRNHVTSEDKQKGHMVAVLAPYVSTLQSHSQVAPVAQLLVSVDLSPVEREELTSLFANALQQLQGDERSFSAAILSSGDSGLLSAFGDLIKKLDAQGVQSVDLVKAIRQYLVSGFKTSFCGEIVAEREGKDLLPQAIDSFNRQFKGSLLKAELAPISAEEIRNARIMPKAVIVPFWQSPTAKRLQADMQTLRFGNGDRLLTKAQRMTPSWAGRLNDFLAQLESWEGNDEPQADFFHEKSVLYETLVDLIPTAPGRSVVLNSYIEFLEQNYFQQISRIEWFWHARRLLDGQKAADDRPQVLLAFLNSRDSILSLYARVEAWELQGTGKQIEMGKE